MRTGKAALRGLLSDEMPPHELQQRMQHDEGRDMRLRRGTVMVSLAGIASMAIVTLYQTGRVKHLPDPPTGTPHFHSDKVNASEEAFGYGMPDGPLALLAHAVNLAVASAGPPDRRRRTPWLPLLAFGLAVPQAAVAAKYLFHQMPKVDKAWCPYCVIDALTHFATLALVSPEAVSALRQRDRH